jgi:hypothetical protein
MALHFRVQRDSALSVAARAALESGALPSVEREELTACAERSLFSAAALRAVRVHLAVAGGGGSVRALLAASSASAELVDAALLSSDGTVAASSTALGAREAWRAEMRHRASHREYGGLVRSVTRGEEAAGKADSIAGYATQASHGLGLLLAFLSSVALGYYAGHVLYGQASGMPLTLAVLAGAACVMVEGSLLLIRLSKADASAAPAAAARERGRPAGPPRPPATFRRLE